MTASVRLDEALAEKLNELSSSLDKKKSEVIRDALELYVETLERKKNSRIKRAVEKTRAVDLNEYKNVEGTLGDGLER